MLERRPHLFILLVYLAASLLFSRAYKDTVTLYSIGDDDLYWSYARSLVYDGDLDFSNEPLPTFKRDPRTVNYASPFPGYLWIPAVFIGKCLTPFLPPGQGREEGISPYHRLLVSGFSAFLTLAGLFLLYSAMTHFLAAPAACLGTLIAFLSSPLLYFTFRRPLMSHSAEFFALAALAAISVRFVTGPRSTGAFWTGLCAGLAIGVRYPNIFVVAAWMFGLWFVSRNRFKPSVRMCLYAISGFLIPASLLLFTWKTVLGSWLPQYGVYSILPEDLLPRFKLTALTLRGIWDIFFGAGWGLAWLETPVLFALWMSWRDRSAQVVLMRWLLAGLLPLIFIAANFGSQGGSYGYRYLLAKSPWVALGAGLFLERHAAAPRARILWSLGFLAIPLLSLLLFESGPEALTLHLERDWVNDRYAASVFEVLIKRPTQILHAASGSFLGHILLASFSCVSDFSFLSESVRGKILERLRHIPLKALLWHVGWIWIFAVSFFLAFSWHRRRARWTL